MHLKLISCDVLARLAYYCAAFSPHIVDIEFLPKGLHNEPATLRSALSERLAAIEPGTYDAILLGYGLCGNSLAGYLYTRRWCCRALMTASPLLGSMDAYSRERARTLELIGTHLTILNAAEPPVMWLRWVRQLVTTWKQCTPNMWKNTARIMPIT